MSVGQNIKFEIEVARCLNGYTWVDEAYLEDRKEPLQVLVPTISSLAKGSQELAPGETYRPLERESALFQILADTEPEPNAIKRFADTYGQIYEFQYPVTYQLGGREWLTHGTPLTRWQATILALRHWTTVWRLVRDRDSRGLLDYAKSLPQHLKSYPRDRESNFPELLGSLDPVLNCPPRERVAMAKQCLSRGFRETELPRNVTVKFRYDQTRDSFGFRLRAEDLVVAVWAQFALAIADSKEYQRCKTCGKPYEMSPDVARTNREYCSTPCRLKAYRGRKREAVRLHNQGKSLKQIAEQLGSDVKTVRGWIKESEEG